MSIRARVTINQDRSCAKCRLTMGAGTVAVKDREAHVKSKMNLVIYYHTECPRKEGKHGSSN